MKPRFKQGDRIGSWMVVSGASYTDRNPRTWRLMAKAQHWYQVACICGSHRAWRAQQELVDKRRVQACAKCRRQIHKRSKNETLLRAA